MKEINTSAQDMATALDLAIRDKEGIEYGYEINNKEEHKKYDNYMSNAEWKKFLNQMSEGHMKNFKDGNGGELEEKKGRYGMNPPKMASFGSSSRLLYELSRDIEKFSFEKKLHTHVGGVANIDGFLNRDNKYIIYVEAKRREIYGGTHKNEKINKNYLSVYNEINKKFKAFSYESSDCDKDNYKKITFKIKDEEVDYFDLKQLICHFLGITYDIIKIGNANIKFLYLLYDPSEVEKNWRINIK